MPTLVGMKDKPVEVGILAKRLLQHRGDHLQVGAFRYGVGYYLSVEHIQNRRQIQFSVVNAYLCHIGRPFHVWLVGAEVPPQHIWGCSADFTLVRTVLPPYTNSSHVHLSHQLQHGLVVDRHTVVVQLRGYAAIAVPSPVCGVNLPYPLPDGIVSVCIPHSLGVIVECGACHPLDVE